MGEHRWSEALAAAHRLLTPPHPAIPVVSFTRPTARHELGRTAAEAMEVLLNGPKSLKGKSEYYYNLGCYNARLGQIDRALQYLEIAFEKEEVAASPRTQDPDLAALRSQLL